MAETRELDASKSKLGVVDGWAIGTGAMIGVTIFVICGTISGLAGPAACLGFILSGALVFCVALVFCEISSALPKAGGAYVYPKRTFKGEAGSFLSFLSGWALWGGQGLGPAMVTVATVSYLSAFLSLVTGGDIQLNVPITATILTALYLLANLFTSGGGRAVQLISTGVVIGIMVLFIVWGGMNMDPDLLDPFVQGTPGGLEGIITAMAMCILSYGGWSTIPNMASEFKNPPKDVPKSIMLSLGTCAIVFALFTYVMNGLLPGAELAASSSPPVAAMNTFTTVGAVVIAIGGLCACVSTSNGLLMTGARVPYAMGVDGDLPKVLGKVSKGGTPYIALVVTAVGQIALCWSGSALDTLVSLVVTATAVSWVISVASSIRAHQKGVKAPFRLKAFWLVSVIAIVGLVAIFVRLAQTNLTGIIMTCVWTAIGIVVYLLFSKTGLKKTCNERKPAVLLWEEQTAERGVEG